MIQRLVKIRMRGFAPARPGRCRSHGLQKVNSPWGVGDRQGMKPSEIQIQAPLVSVLGS